jgi:hypothetical protein
MIRNQNFTALMKPPYACLLLLLGCLGLSTGALHAQAFNWGSAVFSDLVDSEGNTLDDTFVFEVGAFTEGFIPDETNIGEWYSNWQVFDAAAYNGVEETGDDGIYGYFTSTVNMNPDGTSDSPWQTPGALSFEGLDAYIWVRNSDIAGEGTEWSLVRADDWVFPTADPDCCGNGQPIEWSTSDLTSSDTPVWGSQGGITGGGIITNTGTYTLQTATFVPEPSPLMLSLLFAVVILLRRRR